MLGKDGDLIEAIRFYLHSRTDTLTPITIKEAFEDFLCDKQAANLRPLTLQNLRSRVGALVKRMPDRHLSTISAQDFTRILFSKIVKAPWIKVAAMADNDTYIVPGKIYTG